MKFRLCALGGFLWLALAAGAQTTAFTYQGQLNSNGVPATGSYDLRFQIYNANNSVVAGPLTNAPVGVTNGLFITTLDFGANIFNGGTRSLEIGVRTNGDTNAYVVLSPRQALTSVPYAIQALNAATAGVLTAPLPATNMVGTIPNSLLSPNVAILTNNVIFSGSVTASNFTGNGTGLAGVNATTAGMATNAQQWVDPSGNALTTTLLANGVVLVGTNVWVTGSPTNTDNGAWYPWSTNLSLNTIFWTNSATATNGRHFFSDLTTITHGICPGTNDNDPMTIGCPNSIFTGLPNTCQWEYDPVDDNGAPNVGGNATLGIPTTTTIASGVQFNVPVTASNLTVRGTLNAANFSFGVLDETNLDNLAWMHAQASLLDNNLNVKRYGWTNVTAKIKAGQQFSILFTGTGLIGMLTGQFVSNVASQFVLAGDWTGGTLGCGIQWTGAGFQSHGKDGFWFNAYYGTTNTGAALNGYCAVTFPWNVFCISSMLGTNGSSFVLQTNNNSGGGYTTASPTYTTKNGLNTTNGVVWFWTNSAGPQQLGWQLLSTSSGTNRFFGVGYVNTTLSNSFVNGGVGNNGSHLFDELAINTNITAPLWQAWNYDLIIHESIETTSTITNYMGALVDEWKTWSTNSWIILLTDYPASNPSDGYSGMLAYRSVALSRGCSMFDGFSPFVSTNMMVARGMDVINSPHIAVAMPYYAYWLTVFCNLHP